MTSSSAVTAPKLFLRFSTRIASGSPTSTGAAAAAAASLMVRLPSRPDWRIRSRVTLSAIETMIAAPSTRSNVKALIPWSVKPRLRMARTRTPSAAPITVPEPPNSEVPPITAAATA